MKRKQLIGGLGLCLMLFQLPVFGQIYIWNDSNKTWPLEQLLRIAPANTGEFWILGQADSQDQKRHEAKLHRFSLTEGVLLSKQYPTHNLYGLTNLVVAGNGNVFAQGSIKQEASKTLPYRLLVNQEGEMIGHTAVLSPYNILGGDVQRISSKEALVAETIKGQNGIFNQRIHWLDITNQGRTLRTLKLLSEFHEENSKVLVLSSGELILLGRRYLDANLKDWVPLIYKLSSEGKLIWTQVLPELKNLPFVAIEGDSKGNLFVVAGLGQGVNQAIGYQLVQLDPDGQLLNSEKGAGLLVHGITCLKDGRLCLYGGGLVVQEGGSPVLKAAYRILGSDLETIVQRTMGAKDEPDNSYSNLAKTLVPSSSDFLDLIELKGGRLMAVGWIKSPSSTDPQQILNASRPVRNFVLVESIP